MPTKFCHQAGILIRDESRKRSLIGDMNDVFNQPPPVRKLDSFSHRPLPDISTLIRRSRPQLASSQIHLTLVKFLHLAGVSTTSLF